MSFIAGVPMANTAGSRFALFPCETRKVAFSAGTSCLLTLTSANRHKTQLLLDVTNRVVSNLQLRDLLRAISASVRRVMQCDLVGVFLPDSEGDRLKTFVLDFPESIGSIREEYCSKEGSLGGFVFRAGKTWT